MSIGKGVLPYSKSPPIAPTFRGRVLKSPSRHLLQFLLVQRGAGVRLTRNDITITESLRLRNVVGQWHMRAIAAVAVCSTKSPFLQLRNSILGSILRVKGSTLVVWLVQG